MAQARRNRGLFVAITAICVGVAVTYTLYSARTARTPRSSVSQIASVAVPASPSPLPPASSTDHAAAPADAAHADQSEPRPYLVALNLRDSPDLSHVEFAPLDSIDDRTTTGLRCERVYFVTEFGICLNREIRAFSAQTVATFVDTAFRPLFNLRTDGVPSRARISPDGRYAAFTVFVTGHSYADAQLSTATVLVDIAKRATMANLEEFDVIQDGSPIKSADFNYWGVTFERDSNFFYATLRTGGLNYLVHGDVRAKRITVVHAGVECPSLSPDGTRVGFKKALSRGDWRVAVLDLHTLKETILAETRSVDDQVEWLDNGRLLYGLFDPAPWMTIMVVAADGSGQPTVFARGAGSPAVVRPSPARRGTANDPPRQQSPAVRPS